MSIGRPAPGPSSSRQPVSPGDRRLSSRVLVVRATAGLVGPHVIYLDADRRGSVSGERAGWHGELLVVDQAPGAGADLHLTATTVVAPVPQGERRIVFVPLVHRVTTVVHQSSRRLVEQDVGVVAWTL